MISENSDVNLNNVFGKLDILEEDFRTEDFFEIKEDVLLYKEKIDNITKDMVLLGLIAPFGYGKTTFLNQLEKEYEKIKRINFEAWKYPNRENLRESFILEVARSIDPKEFDNALKMIDGKKNEGIKALFSTLAKIPTLTAIEGFNHFLNTSPAKRTFELQEILSQLFSKIEEDIIFFVIEDIDRSGDAGIFFLETLSYFLKKEYHGNKKIKIIVPIGSEQWKENMNSYLKCIDYTWDLSFKSLDCTNLVEKIINPKYFEQEKCRKGQIISFLNGFFKEFSNQGVTIRLLKKGLRESINLYNSLISRHGNHFDFRKCLIIEFSKLVNTKNQETYFNLRTKNKEIGKYDSIFSALIGSILESQPNIYQNNYKDGNSLIEISYPGNILIGDYPLNQKKELFPEVGGNQFGENKNLIINELYFH